MKLNRTELAVIRALADAEEHDEQLTAREVAERTNLTVGQVVHAVAYLHGAGIVTDP